VRPLRGLSYQVKVPLALSAVIVVVASIIAAILGARIYADAKGDLIGNAESLGRTLAHALTPAMLRDEVWQAYEAIIAPLGGEAAIGTKDPHRTITVLDADRRVYVSSDPRHFATLDPIDGTLGSIAEALIPKSGEPTPHTIEDEKSRNIFVAVPIVADDGALLGSVLLSYSEDVLLPRFYSTVQRVLLSTVIALAILVPFGWLIGRRLAAPLTGLASAMSRVASSPVTELARGVYRGEDEIGQLGARFEQMLRELEDKRRLEREMVAADRLAAIGRLTAGIAHEINNPLAGMLTAIDTTRKHGDPDPVVAKTLSLVERGLQQIRHTVSALLVEARVETRELAREDVDDVRTLLQPEVEALEQCLEWRCRLPKSVPLPSASVRQILINLLLNAIQAAGRGGRLSCHVAAEGGQMSVAVRNDGRPIPADLRERLFEPFSTGGEGSGLGLWVTYQIVEQLGGSIRVRSGPPETEFTVDLPLPSPA